MRSSASSQEIGGTGRALRAGAQQRVGQAVGVVDPLGIARRLCCRSPRRCSCCRRRPGRRRCARCRGLRPTGRRWRGSHAGRRRHRMALDMAAASKAVSLARRIIASTDAAAGTAASDAGLAHSLLADDVSTISWCSAPISRCTKSRNGDRLSGRQFAARSDSVMVAIQIVQPLQRRRHPAQPVARAQLRQMPLDLPEVQPTDRGNAGSPAGSRRPPAA